MITINLLPEEMRPKELKGLPISPELAKKLPFMVLGGFLSLQILFSLLTGYRYFEVRSLSDKTGKLREEIKAVSRQKTEITAFKQKISSDNALMHRSFYWSFLLGRLSSSVTKGIWLRDLSIQEGPESSIVKKKEKSKKGTSSSNVRYLKLEGSAIAPGQEMACIGRFLKSLKDDPKLTELFGEIEVSTINQRRLKDLDVSDFTMALVFKKEQA